MKQSDNGKCENVKKEARDCGTSHSVLDTESHAMQEIASATPRNDEQKRIVITSNSEVIP